MTSKSTRSVRTASGPRAREGLGVGRVTTGTCARGRRTNGIATAPQYLSPQDRETALRLSLVLCEEYRVESGPHRAGDGCTTESIVPYAASVSEKRDIRVWRLNR